MSPQGAGGPDGMIERPGRMGKRMHKTVIVIWLSYISFVHLWVSSSTHTLVHSYQINFEHSIHERGTYQKYLLSLESGLPIPMQ